MANGTIDITTELRAIMQAVYGEQVRGSIHNALQKIATECNAWLGLTDGVVTNSKLATGAVSSAKILDSAVNRTKIADHAVNMQKLSEDIGFRKDGNDILYFGGSPTT